MNNSKSIRVIPKLFCLNYRECNPKKCTGFKLEKLNLLEFVNKINSPLKNSIILNPFGQKELSYIDRNKILRYGLIVIDCSWKNIMNLKKVYKILTLDYNKVRKQIKETLYISSIIGCSPRPRDPLSARSTLKEEYNNKL